MIDEERNDNIQPGSEPANEPAHAPESEPSTEPVAEPVAEPVSEPASEPTPSPAHAVAPAKENESARFVYHWKGGEGKKESTRTAKGAMTFGIVMLSAFLIALAALIGVLAFLPGNGSKVVYVHDRDETNATLTVQETADLCNPFTVAIQTRTALTTGSIGTGVIMTEDGYIITNYHVVKDAMTITVYTFDGNTYGGRTVGYDEGRDIAVVKITPTGNEKFPVAKTADYDSVLTGDRVVAIGTPSSLECAWTLTVGNVSYAKRTLKMSDGTQHQVIQFDAAVNPGNSGGPLINDKGEVIGIVQLKIDQNDGIGFAIPVSTITDLFEQLKADDKTRPYLGITIVNVQKDTELYFIGNSAAVVTTEAPGKKFYYNEGKKVYLSDTAETVTASATGLYVREISDGSGCKGVLLPGDIITVFDGQTLVYDPANGTLPDLTVFEMLNSKKAGDKVTMTIDRNGTSVDVTVTLAAKN